MSKFIKDSNGKIEYGIFNDKEFVYEGVNYEFDPYTRRYYRLEESCSLRPEMDGALVKHRTGQKVFSELLKKTREAIENIIK